MSIEMSNDKFILEPDGSIRATRGLFEWAEWYEQTEHRVVGYTKGERNDVSTVFLGLDHSFGMGPPILFETCIFSRVVHEMISIPEMKTRSVTRSRVVDRYSTIEEARAGHARYVEEYVHGEGEL